MEKKYKTIDVASYVERHLQFNQVATDITTDIRDIAIELDKYKTEHTGIVTVSFAGMNRNFVGGNYIGLEINLNHIENTSILAGDSHHCFHYLTLDDKLEALRLVHNYYVQLQHKLNNPTL